MLSDSHRWTLHIAVAFAVMGAAMLPDTMCLAELEKNEHALAIETQPNPPVEGSSISFLESVPSPLWDTVRGDVKRTTASTPTSELPADADEFQYKWQHVWNDIKRDIRIALECKKDLHNCNSFGARALVAIANDASKGAGIAQLGLVNRAINLSVKYTSDLTQYGVLDYWASPIETLTSGAGDCEDYAIAKYAVLRVLGIPEQQLRLVIVREQRTHQLHAVLEVMYAGTWRVLDSRTMVLTAAEQASQYMRISVLGGRSVSRDASADIAPKQPVLTPGPAAAH